MYDRVLKLDPNNKSAHNNLGVLYMKRGQFSAQTEFAAAISLNPDFVDALYNQACLAARQGDKKKAVNLLLNAAAFEPDVALWASSDKDLESLRDLPEFKSLVQRTSRGQ